MRLPIHRESRRGKSINLALSERGLSALRGTGLDLEKTILEASVPMKARMVHIGKNGTQMSQAYDVNGQVQCADLFDFSFWRAKRGFVSTLMQWIELDSMNFYWMLPRKWITLQFISNIA
jgi:hypothetical protein